MLNAETMRAIGMMLARQARTRAMEADVENNEIIDLAPLLPEWQPGSTENPITYTQGHPYTYQGSPWNCAQTHTNHGEQGWEPGVAPSLWAPYHATDAAHALPWVQPTGAHDMYHVGEYMVWTDGSTYVCEQDTAYAPNVYAPAWTLVTP